MPHTDLTTRSSIMERHGSLSERMASEIAATINRGELMLGEAIPSERILAEQFGVSRTVVREAVRTLVAKGLLDVRPGAGTVVTNPSLPDVASSITLLLSTSATKLRFEKVNEVRNILEVEIAGLAAERRDEADLAALSTAAEALKDPDLTRERFVEVDVTFHLSLARATHNELLELLSDSVAHVMARVRTASYEIPGTVSAARHHHGRILAAVRRGDGAASRLAMARHLKSASKTLSQLREI